MPLTMYFWKNIKTRKSGISESIDMANIDPHNCAPDSSINSFNPSGAVNMEDELM